MAADFVAAWPGPAQIFGRNSGPGFIHLSSGYFQPLFSFIPRSFYHYFRVYQLFGRIPSVYAGSSLLRSKTSGALRRVSVGLLRKQKKR